MNLSSPKPLPEVSATFTLVPFRIILQHPHIINARNSLQFCIQLLIAFNCVKVFEGLDPVPPSATEQEQGVGEGVQPELLFDKSGQTVNPKHEVGAAAGDYDPVCTGEICQHDFRTRSTVSTIAASAPE